MFQGEHKQVKELKHLLDTERERNSDLQQSLELQRSQLHSKDSEISILKMEHRYHVAEVKSLKEEVSCLRRECESLTGILSELKDQQSETAKYRDETMSALIENCQLKIVNKKLDYEKGEERKHNRVLRKEVQHLRISCQNLTHENKMQRQGLLKEIRRYIGPKINIDTCDCLLVESQWLFTESASSIDSNCVSTVKVHTVSQASSVAIIVDTPTQVSTAVLPKLSSLVENMSRLSHQTSSCKEKVIFQHSSPLLDVRLLSSLLTGIPTGFDMMSHSVTEQNTSVGSFCSTEILVMRTTQCSQQMSSIVLCPAVTDVSAISVLDRATRKGVNKLVTTSLPCIQYKMGEHSDTQGGYLPGCSEPKGILW